MSELLPARPLGATTGPEPTTLLDREGARIHARRRWGLRAAQWRALELAAAVFGPGVRGHVSDGVLDGPFRGLLHLDVPFSDLDSHRDREARFVTLAGADPVLSRVPVVYVFNGVPVP